jgi:hypothetical protein
MFVQHEKGQRDVAGQPILPVQFSVPVEARKDLKRLAIDISDELVPKGELRYTEMCAYAALYLLSCGEDEVKRIVRAGMAHEVVYEVEASKAKPKVSEPEPKPVPAEPEPKSLPAEAEPKPSTPIKPPVNAASVWKETTPKPNQGDVKGLNSDGPAARKVRKTPRRK